MLFFIIIAVALFVGWSFVCYLLTRFIVRLIGKLAGSSKKIARSVIFAISVVISSASVYFVFFSTPVKNYRPASIESVEGGFKITVRGRRVLMAHDPVSAILRRTYEDSTSFILPRLSGKFEEENIKGLSKKYWQAGSISIDQNHMIIELFYDSGQNDPDSWNGRYDLISR